jgi:riboflavin synthase
MFTGIIEDVGTIEALMPSGSDIRLSIKTDKLDMSDVSLGDSIDNNGVCLTVVAMSKSGFSADISHETIKRTGFASYQAGSKVNLEKALQANSRSGGHVVSGHVDGVGEILSITPVGRYIERLMLGDKAAEPSSQDGKKDISIAFLAENGYLK